MVEGEAPAQPSVKGTGRSSLHQETVNTGALVCKGYLSCIGHN